MSDHDQERLDTAFDSYQVTGAIGSGTLGTVYRAHQVRLNREVAIKFVDGAFAGAFTEKEFSREAAAIAAIYHPNVATIIDAGFARGQPFIVAELVEGINLIEYLGSGPPQAEELLGILSQICEGLCFVHNKGVLHLDLTPRHIMLSDLGWVKLVDFRLSRPFAVDGPGNDHGLPFFSPELIAGGDVDERADVYSVGKLIWYLLTGDMPEVHGDERLGVSGLPEPWDDIVNKAIRTDPNNRYSCMREMCTEVSAAFSG